MTDSKTDPQSEPAEDAPRRRPSPGPTASPTTRARRASGATVDGVRRRPSPGPTVAAPVAAAAPAEPETEVVEAEPSVAPAKSRRFGRKPATGPTATATEAEPVAETAVDAAAATPRPRRHGAPVWVAALLVLVIAGLATLSWVLYSAKDDGGSTTDRDQALAAAKSSVPVILTYSYKEFAHDVAAGKAKLTGRASTDYVTAMTKSIEPTATKVKAVVQAQTDGAGVESVSADGKQVTVIVFGEQKVTNTSLTAARTDIFRVRATLDLVGKQWLVSKFDQI